MPNIASTTKANRQPIIWSLSCQASRTFVAGAAFLGDGEPVDALGPPWVTPRPFAHTLQRRLNNGFSRGRLPIDQSGGKRPVQHLFLGEGEIELLLDDGERLGVCHVPPGLVGDACGPDGGAYQIWA